jgi:prepilin-type N-terminal cleavage/methylation domain-containing protein
MKNKKGFTLVELLVVMSIISVLAAVLLPNYMGARERARDSQKMQELQNIKNALRLYYNDHQNYPVGSGITLGTGFTGYLPQVLTIGHTYYQTNNGDGFQLCVGLESAASDTDFVSQQKCGIGTTSVCGVGTTVKKIFALCAN